MLTNPVKSTDSPLSDSPALVSSHGYNYGVKHFFSTENGTLIQILQSVLHLSKLDSEFLIRLGAVYINKNRSPTDPEYPVEKGSLLRVHTTPRRHDVHHNWKNLIVFDHEDFLVLNKPPNIPSHPSVDNSIENSLTQTSLAIGSPLLISHRLDSMTEGLIVYGKTKAFISAFNKKLSAGQIEKHYVALTELGPNLLERKKNRLIHYMKQDPRAPKVVSDTQTEGWLPCELEILHQQKHESESWQIEINLLTGRTHQIRAQLSFEGLPLLGDVSYGSQKTYRKSENDPEQLALRAQKIRFTYLDQQFEIELSKKWP